MSTTSTTTHRPEDTLSKSGYWPIMIGRLSTAGYTTWGDIQQADYNDLLAFKGIGTLMITTLVQDLRAEGKVMRNSEHLAGLEGQALEDQIARDNGDKNMRKNRSKSKDGLNLGAGMAAAAVTTGRSRRRQQDMGRPYMEVIVQQGYRCKNCNGLTTVGEAEIPPGIEIMGGMWSDEVNGAHRIDPFYICVECAGDVAVVGKLMHNLMVTK